MAFPASPSDGDLHVEGRKHYSYLGGKWYDRMELALVADAAERLKLAYPRDVRTGTLCVQQDTGTTFRFQAPASISDKIKDANWIEVAKSPTATNELLRLTYDPEKPAGHRLDWEDDRDSLAVVPHRSDLHLLPVSHLATGKLVYCTDDSTLYEFISAPSAKTATMTDWAAVGVGIREYNRASDLPQESATVSVVEGELALVRFHLDGTTPLNRVFVARSVTTSGSATIQWVSVNPEIAVNALASDADTTDAYQNDIQVTTEAGHKIVKIYSNGAWIEVYKETDIKQWIAAGNLFTGTIQNPGHGTVGAVEIGNMPAQSALGATDKGHYYTWEGQDGFVLPAAGIGGAVSAIDGAMMNPGDWVQIAEQAPGVFVYTHISGDLLAKSRGDALYGLNAWSKGAYELGSLTVFNGKIYKAARPILATDTAPNTTGSGWNVVALASGLRFVNMDGDLPANAPLGEVYLVINSARASNHPGLYIWDTPSSQWRAIGGGTSGSAMILSGGKALYNVGVPIGSIQAYAGNDVPAGWLFCDGSAYDPNLFPKLNAVLNRATVPDLRLQFIRGASAGLDAFAKHRWTTGMPRSRFGTNSAGGHTHSYQSGHGSHAGINGGDWHAGEIGWGDIRNTTDNQGTHSHSITGGDSETAPDHVYVRYLIKALPETILMEP